MVEVGFGGDDEIRCEGCGADLPAFLDECPYCSDDDYEDETQAPCPSCGAMIYDDSERCPVCGDYVSMRLASGASDAGRTVTIVVVLALIVSLLYMLVARG